MTSVAKTPHKLVQLHINPHYRAPSNVAALKMHPNYCKITLSDVLKINSTYSTYHKHMVAPIIARMRYRFNHHLITLDEYTTIIGCSNTYSLLEYNGYREATIKLYRTTYIALKRVGATMEPNTVTEGYPIGYWGILQRGLFLEEIITNSAWLAAMYYAKVITTTDLQRLKIGIKAYKPPLADQAGASSAKYRKYKQKNKRGVKQLLITEPDSNQEPDSEGEPDSEREPESK